MPAFIIGIILGTIVLKTFGPRTLFALVGGLQGLCGACFFYGIGCMIEPDLLSMQNLGLVMMFGSISGAILALGKD
jgi:hypothetical protein